MSAPNLQVIDRRKETPEVNVLYFGWRVSAVKNAFKRQNEPIQYSHAQSLDDVHSILSKQNADQPFDCIICDMREEDVCSPLNVVSLAALALPLRLIVFCNPNRAEELETIYGVDVVVPEPVEHIRIIDEIIASAPEYRAEDDAARKQVADDKQDAAAVADQLAQQTVEATLPTGEAQEQPAVTPGFESSLAVAAEADRQVWQRFVPVANFLYKKLAIVILSALFATFLLYGAMIVFFMTSSSWSMPVELARGHKLVEKVEREMSTLRVRRNEVRQQYEEAKFDLHKSRRELRDGELGLALIKRTIEEEIRAQTSQKLEIQRHIKRLKQVIADFNTLNQDGGFARNLQKAFAKRLITKKSMNTGTLAVLETMHRIATVESEIAVKQMEFDRVNRRLEYLLVLKTEINEPEIRVVVSAGSDLAHLTTEAIQIKNRIATAQRIVDMSRERTDRLKESLSVVGTNLANLQKTPAARALDAPVAVLFVPYANLGEFDRGQELYGCTFSIIWCEPVAVLAGRVEGEAIAVHPLFGKPMRGRFVEAKFRNSDGVTRELVHVGNPPIFF